MRTILLSLAAIACIATIIPSASAEFAPSPLGCKLEATVYGEPGSDCGEIEGYQCDIGFEKPLPQIAWRECYDWA